MQIRSARSLVAVALTSMLACPAQTNRGTTPQTSMPSGPVRTFTDSDVINGVAAAHEQVFVATARGVIRYPAAGGAGVRMTMQEGLPSNQIFAISASQDGAVWAATPRGVVRYGTDHWTRAGDTQPDVGRITAILALEGGSALVGGIAGVARFDGTSWTLLTNQYQVTAFALDQGRPMVATASSGVLALRGDFTGLDEYGTSTGIPETMVRSFAPIGGGRFWALVQGSGGSKLAYFDGTKWYGYTNEHIRSPWLAVVSAHGSAALVVQGGVYEITASHGDELIPTEAGNPATPQRVTLHPEAFTPAEPSPAPTPPPTRGRGRGRGGRGRHAPLRSQPDEASAQRRRAASLGTNSTAAPAQDSPAPSSSPDPSGSPASASPAPPEHRPPVRPRNIPPYAAPAEVQHGGTTPQAPTFGLTRMADINVPDDLAAAWGDPTGMYLWRIGLGVSRFGGGGTADFRTHDLAMQHRPLSLATDNSNVVWFVTEDGGSARYDGRRFQRVQIDQDGTAVPLLFWSRGTTVAAVARVGPNVVRTYRFGGGSWHAVTERPIDTGGPGIVDVKFLAVDDHGRYWMGIRVMNEGHARENGVAVIDEAQPAATQFNSHTPPTGAVQGAAPAPDDLTAVDFDSHGTAWFAGLSGATSITLAQEPNGTAAVHTYNETNGLRGDLVSDLARGLNNRIFIATPEGFGYWDGQHFAFDVEGASAMVKVIALAADATGGIWGAGPRGGWYYDAHQFRPVGRGDGLPSEEFVDIAVDGENRVWFVTAEGISILTQEHGSPAPSGNGTPASESSGSADSLGI